MDNCWDSIVVGGGVSGTVAAIAAARNHAKTLLVERYGFLGGSLTNAGVGPMMTFHAGSRQVIKGIAQEIVDRMRKEGGCIDHIEDSTGYASSITPFDAETMKRVLDEMTQEAGVDVLYHTTLSGVHRQGQRLESISLYCKGNVMPACANAYVDSTGDAELAYMAGAQIELGRLEDGFCQPMTLNMKVVNVDTQALKQAVISQPDNFNIKDLSALGRTGRLALAGFYREHKKAKAEGRLSTQRADVLMFETVHPGEFILNATRISRLSAVNPWELSKAEREGRVQANELMEFLVQNAAGFKNARLVSTGMQIGIRESRRVMGEYLLTQEDLLSSVPFPDTIALGGYPIDIHSPDGDTTHTVHLKKGQYYSIPFRCLVARDIDNLLVAGRCISATHQACGAIRLAPIAMATGQAAGTAAALLSPMQPARTLPIQTLQTALMAQGAVIESEQIYDDKQH